MHRRAALCCTQAALGLSPESHGSRGGGGLVSVKNSFLFCNCNARFHSLLGRVYHRETAQLVFPSLRLRAAGHHPLPCTGGLQPGPRPALPAESTRHPERDLRFSHRQGIQWENMKGHSPCLKAKKTGNVKVSECFLRYLWCEQTDSLGNYATVLHLKK